MKAYHIAKAQSPADLPVWLFDERDRGVTSRTRVKEDMVGTYAHPVPQQARASPAFRVRDIPLPAKDDPVRPAEPDVPLTKAAQKFVIG